MLLHILLLLLVNVGRASPPSWESVFNHTIKQQSFAFAAVAIRAHNDFLISSGNNNNNDDDDDPCTKSIEQSRAQWLMAYFDKRHCTHAAILDYLLWASYGRKAVHNPTLLDYSRHLNWYKNTTTSIAACLWQYNHVALAAHYNRQLVSWLTTKEDDRFLPEPLVPSLRVHEWCMQPMDALHSNTIPRTGKRIFHAWRRRGLGRHPTTSTTTNPTTTDNRRLIILVLVVMIALFIAIVVYRVVRF